MGFVIVAQVISIIGTVVTILVFIWVLTTWILAPYHPLREALDRVVEPMLAPIRRIMPMTGGVDFSPMILILVIQLGARILSGIILSMALR